MTDSIWRIIVPDQVVGRIREDGGEESMLMTDIRYLDWVAAGNQPLPYVQPTCIDGISDLTQAKTAATSFVKSYTYALLQPTDWVVVREMESGVSAPAEITTYRTAVRAASADKVATIEGKQKLSTLADYLRSDEFAAWPDAPSV